MSEQTEIVEATVEETTEAPGELIKRAEAEIAAPSGRPDYELAMKMGHAMAASGYFGDAKEQAQAAVKMIIGLDLGISPTAAMTAIHIVKGKPMVGYPILAAKIRQHPTYDYRITKHDDTVAEVVFLDELQREGDTEIGRVEWTIDRAEQIGLVKSDSGWAKYPRNMLLARCFSDGIKWYMPDLLTGAAVYVDGEIVEQRRRATQQPEQQRPPALTDERAERLRAELATAYDELKAHDREIMPPGQFNLLVRDAEHSHERLEQTLDHVRDLAAQAAEVARLTRELREAIGDEAFAKFDATELVKHRALRDRADALRGRLDTEQDPDA